MDQLLVAALLSSARRARSMQLRRASRALRMVNVATCLLRDSDNRTLAVHFALFILLLTLGSMALRIYTTPRKVRSRIDTAASTRAGELICRSEGK